MIKALYYRLVIVMAIFILAACTNKAVVSQTHNEVTLTEEIQVVPDTSAVSPFHSPSIENSEQTAAVTDRSGTKELLVIHEFDGQETETVVISGSDQSGDWVFDAYSDFGFYLPPQMKIEKLILEGYAYKTTGDEGAIEIVDGDITYLANEPFENKELSQYTEYVFSEIFPNREEHYFLIQHNDAQATVTLRIFDAAKQDEILPILLDVMQTIKYVPEDKQVMRVGEYTKQ